MFLRPRTAGRRSVLIHAEQLNGGAAWRHEDKRDVTLVHLFFLQFAVGLPYGRLVSVLLLAAPDVLPYTVIHCIPGGKD